MIKRGIQEFFEGHWKNESEFVIRCPYCQDGRTHSHFNINASIGACHCFRCGKGVSLKTLFRDSGLNYAEYDSEFVPKAPEDVSEIELSLFKPIFGAMNAIDRLAFSYLKSRGVTKEEIKRYDLRYADFGRHHGRIIIPVVEDSVFVSFTARSILPSVMPKYLNPHRGETKVTATESLFGYDFARECEEVIIVEGAFDAISTNQVFWKTGRRAVALSTNHVSKEQVRKILLLKKPVIVMLDATAFREGLKVASCLSQYGVKTFVSKIAEGDPSSLKEAIKEGPVVPYSWESSIQDLFR